jgi:hypothetical protein
MNQGEASPTDLYAVLGLSPEAGAQEIRAAYQQLSTEMASAQASPAQREAVEDAYKTLGDPIRHLRYDAQASAPAPSRVQLPSVGLSGMRLPVRGAHVPPLRRPRLRRVDPVLAAAIALVAIVGLAVLLSPLLRGRDSNAPAQSVADLVTSPTPGPASLGATPGPDGAPGSPFLGVPGNGFGQPGGTSSLLPPISGNLTGAGTPPSGLVLPPGLNAPVATTGEPPFLTNSSIIDALRAAAAASAVRAGAPPASLNGQAPNLSLPSNPAINTLQPNPAPGFPPIQANAPGGVSLPPAAANGQPAAAPSTSGAGASVSGAGPPPTVAPTPSRPPNRISVPGIASSGPSSAPLGATQVPAPSTTAPNHFLPVATPVP